jgi:hypothetical protein
MNSGVGLRVCSPIALHRGIEDELPAVVGDDPLRPIERGRPARTGRGYRMSIGSGLGPGIGGPKGLLHAGSQYRPLAQTSRRRADPPHRTSGIRRKTESIAVAGSTVSSIEALMVGAGGTIMPCHSGMIEGRSSATRLRSCAWCRRIRDKWRSRLR